VQLFICTLLQPTNNSSHKQQRAKQADDKYQNPRRPTESHPSMQRPLPLHEGIAAVARLVFDLKYVAVETTTPYPIL
jgi:hypothetical protein